MTSPEPSRLIASLSRDRVTLDLKTVDLCFLAGLYLRADRDRLASFEEEQLVDFFEEVCDVVEPGADNPRKRATHAIQRLREQRMLARVDGAGIVRAGEYALTRLAAGVVQYFIADEALTRESLTLLTGTLKVQLAEVLAAARKAADEEAWRRDVIGPLRITVGDLVSGIERRQRGLDASQEEVQGEIARLLSSDWFSVLDHCQAMLDTTTQTLRELNEVLLRDTSQFVALLQDIQALAATGECAEAEETAQRVIEHVDRIAAWGAARQRAWSDYYQYVHRYLRDVVRLDPDRALSQRVRDQLAGWAAAPFHLAVAAAQPPRLLRPVEARIERPAVERTRADREPTPELVDSEDRVGEIEALVTAAIERGATSLGGITAAILPALPAGTDFASAGRIASVVARVAATRSARERPWVAVGGRPRTLEIEDWDVTGPRRLP